MNVLATKHNRVKALESKGQPLGHVGIIIVLGFVGLVFATAFLGVRAATSNTVVSISSSAGSLTASGDFSEEVNELDISWYWFAIDSRYDSGFNNSDVLSQACTEADGATTGNAAEQFGILEYGLGSTVTLSDDSPGRLYCFAAAATDNGIVRHNFHGGYIPTVTEAASSV